MRKLFAVGGLSVVLAVLFVASAAASGHGFHVYTGSCPGFGVYVPETGEPGYPGTWWDGVNRHPVGEYLHFRNVEWNNKKITATAEGGGHTYELRGDFTGTSSPYVQEGRVRITRDDGARMWSNDATLSVGSRLVTWMSADWKCHMPKS